jgi:riboflavin transporter FmnP
VSAFVLNEVLSKMRFETTINLDEIESNKKQSPFMIDWCRAFSKLQRKNESLEYRSRMNIRSDSRSIALLAIFSAMVAMLEIFPIVGITDLKFFPGGTPFTLDWTGIPIVIVFVGLGMISSVVSIAVMFVAIGYRNFPGAVFKGAAEMLTILGLLAARLIIGKKALSKKASISLYLVFGAAVRAVGMFIVNIPLLPIFYPVFYTTETAIIASTVLVPWNVLQAAVNIIGGMVLYYLIPDNLRIQAGFGIGRGKPTIEELPKEEVDRASDSDA